MIRVLVADDHAVVRRGLIQIMEKDPQIHVQGEASSAGEVFQALRKTRYDVLVLDIAMPGGVGFQVLEQFQGEDQSVPTLVLSIYPEKQYARRSLELGAKGYLTKNSPPEELVAAIHKVARGEVYITPVVAEQLAKNLRRDTLSQPHKKLSQREFQVMRMLAQGKSPTQIAEELSLSPKTVSTYRRRILDKLGLSSTGEIIQYALSKGIVPT